MPYSRGGRLRDDRIKNASASGSFAVAAKKPAIFASNSLLPPFAHRPSHCYVDHGVVPRLRE